MKTIKYTVCHTCQNIGVRHCANPEECNGIKTYPNELRDMIFNRHSLGDAISIIAEKAFDMGKAYHAQFDWIKLKDGEEPPVGRTIHTYSEKSGVITRYYSLTHKGRGISVFGNVTHYCEHPTHRQKIELWKR